MDRQKPWGRSFLVLVSYYCCLYSVFAIASEDNYHFNESHLFMLSHDNFYLSFKQNENIILRVAGKLEAEIGKSKHGHKLSYKECNKHNLLSKVVVNENVNKIICLEQINSSSEVHIIFEKKVKSIQCLNILWSDTTNHTDCFCMKNEFWYGAGELYNQQWPIKNISISETPFVTGDFISVSFFGPLIENLWMNSKGVVIFVEDDVPLTVSINESSNEKLCFSADKNRHPFNSLRMQNQLNYTICTGENVQEIYTYASKRWISKPEFLANLDVTFDPIWSTWARYKADINQTTVSKFSQEIVEHGFTGSQVEIDDKWENCYGDLVFDNVKFPDPLEMTSTIRSLGMKTTLWVHPFVNRDCQDFELHSDYLIKNRTAPEQVLLVSWWNGIGGHVDFSNPAAAKWYLNKLRSLQDNFGIGGFKFDAGEITWLRDDFLLYDSNVKNPNVFSKMYVNLTQSLSGLQEVRVGFKSQSYPVLVRMLDKMSSWSYFGGLKSLIPTGLLFSFYGYPLVLPDMVGGNNYNSSELPEKELFIRWFQASLFFPSLQFSIAPWDYDDETISIVRNNLLLREKYKPLLQEALANVDKGKMVLKPLWVVFPEDAVAQETDSQFLIGEHLLVAPVLEKSSLVRDIYLPEGNWQDVLRGGFRSGPAWLQNYTVRLHELALFYKVL